jgi:hypothetical protein
MRGAVNEGWVENEPEHTRSDSAECAKETRVSEDQKFDMHCIVELFGHQQIAGRMTEQAVRQRWRALALVIKAKLEAFESGIETFEQAFLANILLPDGQTVGQWMVPQVEQAYLTGTMPGLLPMLGDGRQS